MRFVPPFALAILGNLGTLGTLVTLATLTQTACLESRSGLAGSPDGDTDTRDTARDDQADDDTTTLRDTAERDTSDDDTSDLADSQSQADTDSTVDVGPDLSQDIRVDVDCPTAVIGVSPGLEVTPATTLQLTGSQSFGDGVEIVSYRWEVDQPNGSVSTFIPSSYVANPRFDTNVAGVYTFRLHVTDAYGNESCVPAIEMVFVHPVGGIHIELMWDTPEDPNPADTGTDAGSDFDLHLQHPLAVGGFDGDGDGVLDGWFDNPFDVFWDNPAPNWGFLEPAIDDDPMLTMDDTDGAGPELIDFANPELDKTYTVGIHYWDDHGLGNSFVTLRVYLNGGLAFEQSSVELTHGEMWPAVRIHWTASPWVEFIRRCEGTHLACSAYADCAGSDCRPYTLPNYRHPEYFTP